MTPPASKTADMQSAQTIDFTLNGEPQSLRAPAHRLLLDLLRDVIGLTETKEGCGTGDCGACTVMLDGRPANSCLIFAGELKGADVRTIEGLGGSDDLHPLQKAFVAAGGEYLRELIGCHSD